jgi:AI-2 transport protein TqsA
MKLQTDNSIKFFIAVIGLAVIGIVLRELSHIFIPLIIAYFLFFVFSPLNNFFEKRKVPLFLIILLDIAVILFFVWLTSAFLIDSFRVFGEELPAYAVKLDRLVSTNAIALGVTDPYFTEFSIERVISDIDYKLLAGGIFTSTFSLLGSVLFIVFFFVFVVSGHKTIYEALKKRFIVKRSSSRRRND